jgi:hypothetical protein
MTTSSFQRSAYEAYLTVSSMADEASDYAASLKPCSPEWENAYSKAFALRDAAIHILEVNCNAK